MTEISETIRVRAPRQRVYDMWRDPGTFIAIVAHLQEAERDGRAVSWEADGPFGLTLNGEAEITRERRPHEVAWNTIEGALDAYGKVELSEDGDETVVRYRIVYELPGGRIADTMAGDVQRHVRHALEQFKRLAEEEDGTG